MILYQDEHWLVVDKPVGMATHAPRPGELGVVEWLELHLGLKTHVVSRLDRETSGVLLLARDAAASARAQRIHEGGGARKVYEFVSDRDAAAGGMPEAWVREDELDGKPARTEFRRLGPAGKGRLYRAEITRGRTHQVRRHAAASGVPILGDAEHGGARGLGCVCTAPRCGGRKSRYPCGRCGRTRSVWWFRRSFWGMRCAARGEGAGSLRSRTRTARCTVTRSAECQRR
ncbi:MAG: hypothetical protein IPM94_12750 [bacterium]|nr:hypothetical protein [bacterium]